MIESSLCCAPLAGRRGRRRGPAPEWDNSFQFFVTNTYNIIIMVTKVKYNIIATNKSKLYEMFIDLNEVCLFRVTFCACLMNDVRLVTIVVDHGDITVMI